MALDYVPSWPPRHSKIKQSRKLKDRSSYTERGRQLLPMRSRDHNVEQELNSTERGRQLLPMRSRDHNVEQELNSTERGTQLLPQCALTVCTVTIHVRRTGHINQEVASCSRHPDTRCSQQIRRPRVRNCKFLRLGMAC